MDDTAQTDATQEAARLGSGNWDAWRQPLDPIYAAAAGWKQRLEGVERPWLCWNVSHRWCLLQQRLAQEVGWTPVVGFDPRAGAPPLVAGAIAIDFNAGFGFPVMKPHFVIEWAFLIAPRLAFWHSDLLVRLPKLERIARQFEALTDGAMTTVPLKRGLRYMFNHKAQKYFEVIGCTTAGASRDQFEKGAGWWRHFELHPSCTDPEEQRRREGWFYDFGSGIYYWKRRYGGKVIDIDEDSIREGHCTSINYEGYQRQTQKGALRNMGADIDRNYDIEEVARRLELARLL